MLDLFVVTVQHPIQNVTISSFPYGQCANSRTYFFILCYLIFCNATLTAAKGTRTMSIKFHGPPLRLRDAPYFKNEGEEMSDKDQQLLLLLFFSVASCCIEECDSSRDNWSTPL